jgi:hypothetical protein
MSVVQNVPMAEERLASLGEMLSARTRAAYAAAAAYAGADGSDRPEAHCRATIVGMRQLAMVNFDLLMEFELTVLPEGMPPYPATTQQLVSPWQARQLRPGLTLDACAVASNPAAVWLHLENLAAQ